MELVEEAEDAVPSGVHAGHVGGPGHGGDGGMDRVEGLEMPLLRQCGQAWHPALIHQSGDQAMGCPIYPDHHHTGGSPTAEPLEQTQGELSTSTAISKLPCRA